MKEVHYLTAEDILAIHALIIDNTSGLHGVRDVNLLASLAQRPAMEYGGQPLYQTIWHKAAVYVQGLAQHHIFADGNKRTAITAAARFLSINGYELTVSNEQLEEFTLSVVIQKLDVADIANWLKTHSTPNKGL